MPSGVYTRIKPPWNRGKKCPSLSNAFRGRTPWNRGRSGPATQLGGWPRGKPRSAETRAKVSDGVRRHAALDLPDCRCGAHNQDPETLGLGRGSTKLAQGMIALYLSEFPEVIEEKAFGRYRVDAYLPPPYHLAFEADGDYWHDRRGRDFDTRRDAYLLARFGLPVVRLSETEINLAKRKPVVTAS